MKPRRRSGKRGSPIDRAIQHLMAGASSQAEKELRGALNECPGHPDAVHLMGVIRLQHGETAHAIEWMHRAVQASPETALFRENLGEALRRSGDLAGAREQGEQAMRLAPERPAAWALLGRVAMDEGDLGGAAMLLGRALQRAPRELDILLSLMVVCSRAGEHALARQYGEIALSVSPEDPRVHTNLGQTYRAEHRFELAAEAFERAGDFPQARFNLGFVRMHQRDLSGLPLLEARKGLLGIGRTMTSPEWQGEPLAAGTLLVLSEQGMGDTLLMSRFFPQLITLALHVVACVQPPLVALLQHEFPGIRFVSSSEGVECDRWVATMSLPLRLGLRSLDELGTQPWLRVADVPCERERFRVGINWAGNPKYAYDSMRSTHLATFAPLLGIEEVEWVSLHRGHLEHEAAEFGLPQPLATARDFLETARVLRSCDLVLSTETAVPNLSAAMGVPTAVLTSPDYDWRWKDWYPGVRICAQETLGDWNAPMAAALELLGELLAARGSLIQGDQRAA